MLANPVLKQSSEGKILTFRGEAEQTTPLRPTSYRSLPGQEIYSLKTFGMAGPRFESQD
jgi:hypothetical protein